MQIICEQVRSYGFPGVSSQQIEFQIYQFLFCSHKVSLAQRDTLILEIPPISFLCKVMLIISFMRVHYPFLHPNLFVPLPRSSLPQGPLEHKFESLMKFHLAYNWKRATSHFCVHFDNQAWDFGRRRRACQCGTTDKVFQ